MKHYTILIALLFAIHFQANGQAFIIPNSGNNDATILGCDSLQLTPDFTFQQGTAWYRNQLNLNNPFHYTFMAYFGNANGVGADGMAFIVQNQNQTLGPQGSLGGAQLGYYSFPGKSMAIEFDTHNNQPGAPYGDIPAHHIAIDTGGIQFPQCAAPVPALPSSANIDDGLWHKIEIVWTPATETMAIYFDGNLRLTCVFNPGLVTQVFGGQNMLYWGWAGCTGSKYNQQQIYIPFHANFSAAVHYAQCGLTNVPFADSSVSGLNNIASWAWDFGDGNTSTQQNPVHSYTQPGQYNVKLTVTDAGGCSADTTIQVSVYSIPVITASQTNVTCNGAGNGVVRAITTGGTEPYTFNWFPAVSTIDSATSLPPGDYAVIVIDHNGCADSAAYIITQPPVLTDSFVQVNVLCNGQATGSLTSVAGGGTPGYSYSWSPNVGNTSPTSTNLAAGPYSTTVTDANGCKTSIQTTITQPPLLTANLVDSNVRCFGASTGYIIITPNGGTPGYTYHWSPSVTTTDSAMNIAAGNYAVTLTDANNCSVFETATISQPSQALVPSAVATPVLCYGQASGTIVIGATGGTPNYTFSVTNGGTPITSSNDTFNNLTPATYTVLVTDHNDCSASTSATVNQPPQLTDILDTVEPKCFGYSDGQITALASGGTPGPGYSYKFSNGVIDTSGVIDNLIAGSYRVTITDNSGCTITDSTILSQPDTVTIEVTPTPVQVKLGQQLQLGTTTNQTGIVTYTWSPAFGLSCDSCPDPVFNGVYSEPYQVVVTNQNGCFGTFAFTVTVVPDYDIYIPNAFTPGAGGANAYWQIFGLTNAIKHLEVSVFDRIGEKVFESDDINFMWDGSFKGKPAAVGVYTYQCKVVWLNNYSEKAFVGTVTLLR